MKKLKILPSILMLVLCIGILAVGVFAITPTKNTISGTITINASNEPVTITIYKDNTGTTPIKTVTVRAGTTIPIQSAEFELGTANTVSEVLPIKYVMVFSTTSSKNLVIDTETIEQYDAVAYADNTRVVAEEAVIVSKHHKYLKTDSSTGLACFTTGNDYTITCTFKLGKFVEEKSLVNFNMAFDIYEANEYTGTGINGVDYLYFGEYPQSEANVSIYDLTPTNLVFNAYRSFLTNKIYLDEDGNRYVENTSVRKTVINTVEGAPKLAIENTGEKKLYKIEPIKWRILNEENGTALLMCDMAMEGVNYVVSESDGCHQDPSTGEYYILDKDGNRLSISNYEYSSLRKFLNNNFFGEAFNVAQKRLVQLTTVDNSAQTTDSPSNANACGTTKDYVFALSYQDLINTEYGFESSVSSRSINRIVKATDYCESTSAVKYTKEFFYALAGAYGLSQDDAGAKTVITSMLGAEATKFDISEIYELIVGSCEYWLRSPSATASNVFRSSLGVLESCGAGASDLHTCVPAINISLK